MGILSGGNDEDSAEKYDNTFKPIATDGNRVLGYFNDGSGRELVWVNEQVFDKLDPDRIDKVV